MKKVLIMSFVFILVIISVFLLKNNYEKEVEIELPSYSFVKKISDESLMIFNVKKIDKINEEKNNYLNSLTSCYDESFFYDSKGDVTITKYEVKNNFLYRNIEIFYKKGNLCENEFVLDENWYLELKELKPLSIEFENCENSCPLISVDDYDRIYDYFFKEIGMRISSKKNIAKEKLTLNIHYSNYILEIFTKDEYYVAFNLIDRNDAKKNAVYFYDNLSLNKFYNLLLND